MRIILGSVLALLMTGYSLYLKTHSNFNFGVLLVYGLTGLIWVCLLLHKKLPAFYHTLPGKLIIWLFVLGFAVFFALLFFVIISGYADEPKGDEKAVIVLGAGLHGEKISRLLQYRLDKAYEYYQENPEAIFITTGGQGRGESMPEGRAMRKYLIDKGIPAEQVFAEEESSSTEENFAFSREILKEQGISEQDPMVLVTNSFHCYRAGCYAKMAGYTQMRKLPAGISFGVVMPCYFREVFALLYYWFFRSSRVGWMQPFVGLLAAGKRMMH